MSSPRLPTQMEVMEMLVEDGGVQTLRTFLVPRDSGPLLASGVPTGLVRSNANNVDGGTSGAVAEILRARTRLPSSHLELGGQVMVKVPWEVSSPAAAGTTARILIEAQITPSNGQPAVSIAPQRGAGAFGVDETFVLSNWIVSPIVAPRSVGYRFEAGDLLEMIISVRTETANGGAYDVIVHHDPTSDPDRLLVEWMTGVET